MTDRVMYNAVVSFDTTQTGIVGIMATSEDHAKEILGKQFASKKNFEIIDIFEAPKELMENNSPTKASETIPDEEIQAGERLRAMREELVKASFNKDRN